MTGDYVESVWNVLYLMWIEKKIFIMYEMFCVIEEALWIIDEDINIFQG